MELHERIYQLRKEHNMTQQDMADQLGVSRQAVSRWEMGTAKPEIENLTAMSRIFCITVDELLTGEKPFAVDKSDVPEQKKTSLRKWVIAWAVTYLTIVAVYAVWLLVQWKVFGALVAIAPVTLVVQLINMGFRLGFLFVIGWFVRHFWK